MVAARACSDDVKVNGVLVGWVVDGVGFDGCALTKLVAACSQGWDMGQHCVKGFFFFVFFGYFWIVVGGLVLIILGGVVV